jgi:tetratricopeptide (TPR) repeat protein
MARGSHRLAGILAAVFGLVLGSGSSSVNAQQPPWAECTGREIAAILRGCGAIIGNPGNFKSLLPQARLNRGKALAKRGSLAEAIADLSEALKLNPGTEEIYQERGEAYAGRKEIAAAEMDFAAVLRTNPSDARTYAARGWLYKAIGDDVRAKADFEQALKFADRAIAAKAALAQAQYSRGEALAGLGDYDKAIAAYDEAIKLKPDNEAAYADRGIAYSLKGAKEQAIADLNKALELQPGYWHALNERGNLFVQSKDYAKAISGFDVAIEAGKDNAQAFNARGAVYRLKGDLDRAIADANEAIRLSPKYADAYGNRAWAYSAQKDCGHAIADFTLALELNPKMAAARSGRGSCYIEKKDFAAAVADYDALVAQEPGAENRLERGQAYFRKGDYASALADFDEAIRLKPDMWEAHSARARVHAEQGNYDKQIADLKEEIRLKPDVDISHIALAQAYHAKGEHTQAIGELETLLKRKPDYDPAYRERSLVRALQGEYDAAIADASEAIRLRPDDPGGYTLRANAYRQKKDTAGAIADTTQAIRLDPDHAEANYFARADLYNLKGDYERAASDESQAIGIALSHLARPESAAKDREANIALLAKAYAGRAVFRASMADYENAFADCNEAIRLRPDKAGGYSRRGMLYSWQAQYDAAIADFDKALALDATDANARTYKAIALLKLNRAAEAMEVADKGLRSAAHRDAYIGVRGMIAYEQGKYAQALDDLSEAIKLAALKAPAFYLYRGLVYEKLGLKAPATADYKEAAGLEAINPAQREARIEARERLSVLEAERLTGPQTGAARPGAALGRRIALVIGAGAYENAPALRNPANDAGAMAAKLRELGFAEVIELIDPNRAKLDAAVMAFGDKVPEADWAVVFYTGHAMQVDGRNFLIPTDAKLETGHHVSFETIPLSRVIQSLTGAKKLGLLILDACRDNPFVMHMRQTRPVRSFGQGLAVDEPGAGQMIAYATKDGSVAEDGTDGHSPFTKALLDHIGDAQLDMRLMFSKVRDSVARATEKRQQPFTYGSLPGEGLFFKMAAVEKAEK